MTNDFGMKNAIEVEGSSVEDAIQKAVGILKIPREQINIKIVCEEKKGLFGMEGAKPAKIKAAPKEIK
ncbi:MAG: Jag N-terminal domain-containing protein [Candidatus Omnitrophica bacterium]|nr:Jag N-terminal domain-containing protein [Candidatus Omnitrophota bacterium]